MPERLLITERKDGVVWLKLFRPDVLNCLNRPLLKALIAQCRELERDKETRVVAVIGAGAKVFCAGADLKERRSMSLSETVDYISLIQSAMDSLESLPQVVIAAINGSAFGGGTELALACDLRVMVAGAALQLTEVKLGIIPGAGGTQRLPRLIGKSIAKELILTGAPLTAERGYSLGLIHRVVDKQPDANTEFHEPLIKEVESWAKEIAAAAPLSLRQAKFAIDKGFDCDMGEALALETKAYLQLLNTSDRLEGLKAFAEKRAPVYRGE